jgi:hypothetical protein
MAILTKKAISAEKIVVLFFSAKLPKFLLRVGQKLS